ncbi:MAG: hemolysin III family protein [Eubacteriales bacterium]
MRRTKLRDRLLPNYTHGEEVFNMVTHIVGGALGVVATVLCVVFAALHHNVWGVVGGAIFGATMIVLYTMSSVYHGLSPRLAAKKVFQIIDHCSIFFLIAGTYTPIALVSLREYKTWIGWTVFGFIWGMAVIGIVLNAIDLKKYKLFSMICYLVMGWCIVLVAAPTFRMLTVPGTVFLILGGVSYTVGAVLFCFRVRYLHSVFHIFCVIGSLLHFFCILFYVM